MTMWLKYTPFKYYYSVKKNQLGIWKKKLFFAMDVFPKKEREDQ